MQQSRHIIFFLMLLILTAASTAVAQDAGMSDVEIVDDAGETGIDKVVFSPGEDLRYIPRTSPEVSKDSVALQIHDFPMQQATMKAAEKTNEKQTSKSKDDSILTYNFLYYIIQKYKLQDIID